MPLAGCCPASMTPRHCGCAWAPGPAAAGSGMVRHCCRCRGGGCSHHHRHYCCCRQVSSCGSACYLRARSCCQHVCVGQCCCCCCRWVLCFRCQVRVQPPQQRVQPLCVRLFPANTRMVIATNSMLGPRQVPRSAPANRPLEAHAMPALQAVGLRCCQPATGWPRSAAAPVAIGLYSCTAT